MVTEEKLRERFEEWVRKERVWLPLARHVNDENIYAMAETNHAFAAWQAAEAAGFARGREQGLRDAAHHVRDNRYMGAKQAILALLPKGKDTEDAESSREGHDNQADVCVVRPLGGGVLGPKETGLVPLPITDDRNSNPLYAAFADINDE